jgi:hypothetical protein
MTRQQIETIQKSLEDELASPVNADDGTAVRNKLERLTTFLGTGAQCIAQSHDLLKRTKGAWLRQHIDKISDMKPSVAKEFINTGVIDEETLYVRCDRNYSATCKAVEALRSILSLIKTEINAMS